MEYIWQIAILFLVLMVNLRLSFCEVLNSNFNILNTLRQLVSTNSHALSENIVLINSKIFFNSKF